MHRGFITLHRKIVDWEWYSDINVFRLFTHLILTANWKPKRWQGEFVKRGQRVISIQNLAQETGLTEQSVRTAIKKLKSTGELTSKSTNKYTVVTLTNYELYQSEEKQITGELTSKLTDEEQTNNKRITTTKQCNNITMKTKKEDTPAFFDKKASDDLPFAYECEKKESVVKKSQSMFEEFWRAYPKKTGKKKVAGIYERLISRGEVTHDELIDGISAYKKSETVKKGFIKNPETWLNGGCWADEHTANDEESEWWGNDEIEQQIEDQLWIDDPVGMQRQQDAAKAAAAIAKKMAEEKKEQAKKAQEALK